MKIVMRVCKRLNDAGVRLDGGNSVFATNRVEWAGYELEQNGSWPINSAAQGISGNLRPNSVKQLKTFLSAVKQYAKFIPRLNQLCEILVQLLKTEKEWDWNTKHEEAFVEINAELKRLVLQNKFERGKELRIICDASKAGLGSVLQQKEQEGWVPINFASRYLSDLEKKYSTNELELLAVVWSIENYRNYVEGKSLM